MLKLQSAEYTLIQGRPAARLIIDGKEAFLIDVKKSLLDAGYVYLISLSLDYDWTEILPPMTLPPIPSLTDRPMTLRGITDDPEIVRIARAFISTLDSSPKAFAVGAPIQ